MSGRFVVMACLLLVSGCGYWSARPTANTAPSSWAASSVATPAPAASNAPTHAAVVERLQNLDELKRSGVIDATEYRQRRQAILDAGFDVPGR